MKYYLITNNGSDEYETELKANNLNDAVEEGLFRVNQYNEPYTEKDTAGVGGKENEEAYDFEEWVDFRLDKWSHRFF